MTRLCDMCHDKQNTNAQHIYQTNNLTAREIIIVDYWPLSEIIANKTTGGKV